jgi:hypothetical protein
MKSTVDLWIAIFIRVGQLVMGRGETNRNTYGIWKRDQK